MKKILIPTVVMVCLLTASAAVAMGQRGQGVEVMVTIPVLPAVVVLEEEPYYYHSDYYYHYNNDRWYYARSRSGPWVDLPRDHYPKETRYKGKSWRHDRGRDHEDRDDRRRDRRDDNRGRDNQRR